MWNTIFWCSARHFLCSVRFLKKFFKSSKKLATLTFILPIEQLEGGESMSPHERRLKIVEELQNRRRDTYSNLAFEFSVSKRTIQYDVEILSCFYPIETISGKGGGVSRLV